MKFPDFEDALGCSFALAIVIGALTISYQCCKAPPPLALQRVERVPDGHVRYVFSDGSVLVVDPLEPFRAVEVTR